MQNSKDLECLYTSSMSNKFKKNIEMEANSVLLILLYEYMILI